MAISTSTSLQQTQQSGARCYIAGRGSVNDVINSCFSVTGAGEMYSDIGDFICGIWCVPFNIPVSGLTKARTVAIGLKNVGAGDYCYTILASDDTTDIDRIASFTLDCRNEARGNFLDYGSYTLSTLYLPFFGLIKMESRIIFNSTLSINYYFDATTTTLGVRVIASEEGVMDTLIYESNTSVGVPLELRSTNAGYISAQKERLNEGFVIDTISDVIDMVAMDRHTKKVRKLVGVRRIPKVMAKYNNEMAQMTTIGSIITNGLRTASNIKALRQNGTRVSSLSQSGSLMSIRKPFICIEQCKYEIPTNYGHEIGYIVNNEYMLSEMHGYTIVENVHLEIPCTSSEIEELEEILLSGVVITTTPPPTPPEPEPPNPDPEPPNPDLEPPTPDPQTWLSPWSGSFRVTSPMGYRIDPFTGQESYHSGIDMVGIDDTTIYSISAGVVTHIGYSTEFPARGYYCEVDDSNGNRILYMHMTENSSPLSVGSIVSKGSVIGLMGNTGRVTGAHLDLTVNGNKNVIEYTGLPNTKGVYS